MDADLRTAREIGYAIAITALVVIAMDAWPKLPQQTVAESISPGPEHGPMPSLVCIEPGPEPRWTIGGATVERGPRPCGPYRDAEEAIADREWRERTRNLASADSGPLFPVALAPIQYGTGYQPPVCVVRTPLVVQVVVPSRPFVANSFSAFGPRQQLPMIGSFLRR